MDLLTVSMDNKCVEDIKWTKRLEEIEGFPRGDAYCITLRSEQSDDARGSWHVLHPPPVYHDYIMKVH